jgi:N-hydroxyarylamine O-acetyltransferase
MTEQSAHRILVLGRLPQVLQGVMQQLAARGMSARGSIDAEHAADQFDAKEFDLISFGGGIVGPLNERLRLEFARQNSQVQFLDVFAPVAVKQIISALRGPDKPLR